MVAGLPPAAKTETARFKLFPETMVGGSNVLFYLNAPSDPVRFEYASNPRGYFDDKNGVEHPTNSIGFRGPEFELEPQEGTFRIAFIGDSFTFGEGVWHEDTYPEVTAALLEESQGARVEALNFGVGGYNMAMQTVLLDQVLSYKPDLVVIGYVLNDAEPPLYFGDGAGGFSRTARPASVEESPADLNLPLRSLRLLQRVLKKGERNAATVDHYQGLYRADEHGWKVTQGALAMIQARCRDADVPVVMVCFPILHRLSDYPFRNLHDQVGSVAADLQMPFIDVLPEVTGRDTSELWVHVTDHHPNEIVHRMVAERLAAWVRESGRGARDR